MGATVEDIAAWLGRPLPEQYRSFLAATPRHYLAGEQTLVYGLDILTEWIELEMVPFGP